MKYTTLLLAISALLFISACNQNQSTGNYYTQYESIVDNSKPISYGEDKDVYLFAGGLNLSRTVAVLDTSLTRKVQLTTEEQYFSLISKDISQIDEFYTYKNLILCGTLEGTDNVSAHIRKTLANNFLAAARKSGAELFVVKNLYVRDQIILYLVAQNNEKLEQLVNERADQIFGFLKERFEQRQAYQAYKTEVIGDKLFEDKPFNIKIPVLYQLYKDDPKGAFLSFIYQPHIPSRQVPDKYVSVYHEAMPTNTLDANWLFNKRQELGKKYFDGDEIIPEKYTAEPVEIAGVKGWRIYGHWINKNLHGGVGGAFQTFAFWHSATQTAYLVDNIVFFTDGLKLPALTELGMISRSITIK